MSAYVPYLCLLVVLLATAAAGVILRRYVRRIQRTELLLKALDQTPMAIALLDHQDCIVFWSHALALLTGITQEQAIGHHWYDFSCFPEDQPVARMIRGLPSRSLSQPLVFRSNLPTNTARKSVSVMINLSRFRPEAAQDSLLQLVLLDVSETDELQARLHKALQEAEINIRKLSELDRLKSEFLAICGHELKTPLVSITGYLDLMSSERLGDLTDKQRNALQVSLRNASRLNDLLSSLLDFARMEAGKMSFSFSPQRLESIIDEVVAMVHPMAEKKQLHIVVEVPRGVFHVLVDAGLIHRALANILDNAMKFSNATASIIIRCYDSQDRITVEILDNGVGCDPELVQRLKEPFFQADTSDTRRAGGLGLGLAICDRILSGHGTNLEIVPNSPKGTTIRFSLQKAYRSPAGKPATLSATSRQPDTAQTQDTATPPGSDLPVPSPGPGPGPEKPIPTAIP